MREETERVLVGVALQTNMSGHPIIDAVVAAIQYRGTVLYCIATVLPPLGCVRAAIAGG